jgi:VWFA-related protein
VRITQIDRSRFPEVRVFVSATDASGEPVPVGADELRLFENGQAVEPRSILGAGEIGPLTTMLVVDISGSMAVDGKLEAAQEAALAYVDQMQPGDQTGLIAFDVESNLVQSVTEDRLALAEAIRDLQTGGDTAMFDALVEGVRSLDTIGGRKAIIVLTDGMDNSSHATLEELLRQAGDQGPSISAVGLGDRSELGVSFAGLDEGRLEALAARAGGRYARTADAVELRQVYERLGRALHSEYVVTYVTALPLRDGVNRTLDVRLASSAAAATQRYNPGGVIPEVAQPALWSSFGLALAALAALLLLPALIRLGLDAARSIQIPRRGEPRPTGKIRLHEAAAVESRRIRLH